MEDLDYWRLCDELTVRQAALLIVGISPTGEIGANCDNWQIHERPVGYEAAKAALSYAILSGKLPATIRRSAWERGWDEEPGDGEHYTKSVHIFSSDLTLAGCPELREGIPGQSIQTRGVIYRAEPDWNLTTVAVDDLRLWLSRRGFKTGFFFPESTNTPDYLDPQQPYYASKLAAAIDAWQAVTADPELLRGVTAKQAIMKWLRKNADRYGLTKDDGNPNELGIEEVAKIANWDIKGGAPKTLGG
jgi:hypothetical protein